jgi:hypothetical protein
MLSLHKKSLLTLFTLILALSAANVDAATYYVDNTVTNSNFSSNTPDCIDYNLATFTCGAGTETVFATLADINSLTLSPGDTVLLRRGQFFRETLNVPSSGTINNPITFGAFGSGIKPTLYGSDFMDGTWTLVNGTIYKITLSPNQSDTVLNGEVLLDENDGNFASLSTGEWDWENEELFVNIGTDPTGGYIEAGQRPYVLRVTNKDYITIEDIIIRNADAAGTYVNSTTANNVGIIFNNVEAYGTGNDRFKQETSNGFTNTVTYNNVISRFNMDDGLSLHGGGIATVNTGLFSDNVSGINNIRDSHAVLNDVTMENNSSYGLWLLNPSTGIRGTTIMNNAIFNDNTENIVISDDQSLSATGVTINGGNDGVFSQSTREVNISNISITNTTGRAFRLLGSGDVDLRSVSIDNTGDGIYGPLTYTGITDYQRAQGLQYIDGVVGPETSASLNAL